MCVCHVCAWCLQMPKEVIGFPGTEVKVLVSCFLYSGNHHHLAPLTPQSPAQAHLVGPLGQGEGLLSYGFSVPGTQRSTCLLSSECWIKGMYQHWHGATFSPAPGHVNA